MTTDLINDLTTKPPISKSAEIPAMCKMTNMEINKKIKEGICPQCGGELQNGGNCYFCPNCFWERC
jgi:hypothetical protein